MEEQSKAPNVERISLWTLVLIIAAFVVVLCGLTAWREEKNEEKRTEARCEVLDLKISHIDLTIKTLKQEGEIIRLRSRIRKLEESPKSGSTPMKENRDAARD